jgi:tetratricopeptide (TPR) repeat protein
MVFDTNVLLSDPYAIFSYEQSQIVIPQIVLSELDKLKTSRTDKEVRFRGREFSRTLFELSDYGVLTEGIELDNDSIVKVVPFNPSIVNNWPATLSLRNADDQILATTWLMRQQNPDSKVVLVTNDLNMLLKAQTLGLEVIRHEYEENRQWLERLRRLRVAGLWILLPIAIGVLLVLLWLFRVPSPIPATVLNPITRPLQSYATQELEYLQLIKKEPNNIQAWIALGTVQLNWADSYRNSNQNQKARSKYEDAINTFRHVLQVEPNNPPVRTKLGYIYFILGSSDKAITEFLQAISLNPDYPDAHYYLGVVLYVHQDFKNALKQFKIYLNISPNGNRAKSAKKAINEIKKKLSI